MWKKYAISILLSSLFLSIIYNFLEYGFHPLRAYFSIGFFIAIIAGIFMFSLFFLVFALPIQLLLKKYMKKVKFSIQQLFIYVCFSGLIHIFIVNILLNHGNVEYSVLKDGEIYVYIISTSFIYWFLDSVIVQKQC